MQKAIINSKDNTNPLVELRNINQTFPLASGQKLQVLKDINLSFSPGEIVVLLGPSGSGKSTCLRLVAGLLTPTLGDVLAMGEPLSGPNPMVSMVFQSFVLLPWLTTFENIALGLAPLKLPMEEEKERVRRSIDLVGLEGFEEAYPKELSGGMKQRVGIARALVMERPMLCLDEPFSALDVLTAETLRKEVLSLWLSKKTSTQTILLVTHNVTEAVSMGQRILVMGTQPGHIRVSIKNDLPYPRDERSVSFQNLVENVHDIITEAMIPDTPDWIPPALIPSNIETLPHVPLSEVIGLIEFLSSRSGRNDVFTVAHTLGKDFGRILFLTKAAEILDFVDTPRNQILLTEFGNTFVHGDVNLRKKLLNVALRKLRLFQSLQQMLSLADNHTLSQSEVFLALREWLPNENVDTLLDTVIEWGRYAELFGYNDDKKELYLDTGQDHS